MIAALAGFLFAAGLALSGMTSPARVIGFLDVAGAWDPQLMFVMGGALASYALLYRWVRRRFAHPLLEAGFHVPDGSKLDPRLVLGAALFGVGWGLMGLCPGPALVAVGAGKLEALAFAVAMAAGMVLANTVARDAD